MNKIDDLKNIVADLEQRIAQPFPPQGAPAKPSPNGAPTPQKPVEKEEPEDSPYEVRREETVDTTRSFADEGFDRLMESLDSYSIFKSRVEMVSKQEGFRINPEDAQQLIGMATEIEQILENAYDRAEDLMLALEAGKLGN